MNQGMNIHSSPGDKVIYANPTYGCASDQAYAEKYLQLNQEYTIEDIYIDGYSTEVYLEEVPGISFNSVLFENANMEVKSYDIINAIKHNKKELAITCALLHATSSPEYSHLTEAINEGIEVLRKKTRRDYIQYIQTYAGDEYDKASLWDLAVKNEVGLHEVATQIVQWYCNELAKAIEQANKI